MTLMDDFMIRRGMAELESELDSVLAKQRVSGSKVPKWILGFFTGLLIILLISLNSLWPM